MTSATAASDVAAIVVAVQQMLPKAMLHVAGGVGAKHGRLLEGT